MCSNDALSIDTKKGIAPYLLRLPKIYSKASLVLARKQALQQAAEQAAAEPRAGVGAKPRHLDAREQRLEQRVAPQARRVLGAQQAQQRLALALERLGRWSCVRFFAFGWCCVCFERVGAGALRCVCF